MEQISAKLVFFLLTEKIFMKKIVGLLRFFLKAQAI